MTEPPAQPARPPCALDYRAGDRVRYTRAWTDAAGWDPPPDPRFGQEGEVVCHHPDGALLGVEFDDHDSAWVLPHNIARLEEPFPL